MEVAQESRGANDRHHLLVAEFDPPKGTNLSAFISQVLQVKGRVDAVRVTDSQNAIMRMHPLAPCLKLAENGVSTQMVINGRDRNRISLQAELLSASALGIDHLVLEQGHDPAEGDQPVARSSGDLDLDTMVQCASNLNQGRDLAGEDLDGATDFDITVSLNLSDDVNHNRELAASFDRLAALGIHAVTLGPTYDLNLIEPFLPVAEQSGIRLFTSLMYLKSVAMVRYLNNLPGIPSIPQEFLKTMMQAAVKRDAGMQVAADLYGDLKGLGAGTVLLAIGWKERLGEFLDAIGR
jgi:methylenetetrahydrofolate reductase (NADPH)